MKGFKLFIKPKRLSKTKNNTYTYLVSGPEKMIQFYKDNLESVMEDDDTGQPLFFHKKLFAFGGELTFSEREGFPFSAQPNIQSALALESMAGMMAEMKASMMPESDESDEDSDDAELESPKAKPKATVTRKVGKK